MGVVAHTLQRFAVARLKMFQALLCFALGWLTCIAWMLVIRFAPEAAVSVVAVLKSHGIDVL